MVFVEHIHSNNLIQDMYLSTLGYKENPLILKHQNAFLIELKKLWQMHFEGSIPEDTFLLFPDVHSNLLALTHMHSKREYLKNAMIQLLEIWKNNDGRLANPESFIENTQIELTDVFSNPYIDTDSHPDHIRDGIKITFANTSPSDWQDLFSQAFSILKKTSPGFYEEINFLLKKILPFGVTWGTHNSGSYSNAIGHITMSYPLEVDTPEIVILEALIHEYNHNKINLILQNETLLANSYDEVYYSPYRPDPRSIHGIYLGLHALSAAYWVIWKAHLDGNIVLQEMDIQKGVLYVLKNSLSIQMLEKYALFTSLGKDFFFEMKQVHNETLGFMKQSKLPVDVLKFSKERVKEHYSRATEQNPSIFG